MNILHIFILYLYLSQLELGSARNKLNICYSQIKHKKRRANINSWETNSVMIIKPQSDEV